LSGQQLLNCVSTPDLGGDLHRVNNKGLGGQELDCRTMRMPSRIGLHVFM